MTEPLIKLDDDGQAPLLRYDLPEPTFYYGRNLIDMGFPTDYFLPLVGKEPELPETNDPDSNDFLDWLDDVVVRDGIVELGEDRFAASIDRFLNDIVVPDLDSGPIDPSQEGPGGSSDPAPRRVARRQSVSPAAGAAAGRVAVDVPYRAAVGLDPVVAAAHLEQGQRPVIVRTATGAATTVYVPIEVDHTPALYLVETHRLSSFRGDYGAGKTLNTSTLNPGERQKIHIETYKNSSRKVAASHSLFDSYTSETEDSFESSVRSENSDQESKDKTVSWNVEAEATANWGVAKASISGGASGSTNTARETFAKNVTSATEKHAVSASGQRDVEVNTTTEVSVEEGEATSIEREIENVNISRTLNLGFRQLNQEFISILHLIDVEIAFYNGYDDTRMQVPLADLDRLLDYCIAKDAQKDLVREDLLFALRNIVDHAGALHTDLVRTTRYTERDGSTTLVTTIDPHKTSTYTLPTGREFEVPGIIMSATNVTLRTDGVIVDAMLGGGEALDQHSIELQEEKIAAQRHENSALVLANRKVSTALDIIESGDTARADLYQQLFVDDPRPAQSSLTPDVEP